MEQVRVHFPIPISIKLATILISCRLITLDYNSFMGSNQFCFKVCDNAVPNSKVYCNNVFDLEGCDFNAPAKVRSYHGHLIRLPDP